ncbi:Oidioi.mRNA.OKI2018_I69.chr1.g2983.t1.cds [Oikopleura dioica]|uniref:Oidioi.mRNA.OKI2018_I69.chr1.g2983.t1.cds n=1 Tax=Oikopleura dioica TaxID=34765 RepID=A0ABN7SST1_OIKDI|nr:Oidioi.mRNA.OKI2018_I69.chr1.g2983.t1.cds [Oikopleura dioica]
MREFKSERPLTSWERATIKVAIDANLDSVSDLIKAKKEYEKDVNLATRMMLKMKITDEAMEVETRSFLLEFIKEEFKKDVEKATKMMKQMTISEGTMEWTSLPEKMEIDSEDETMEYDQMDAMEE